MSSSAGAIGEPNEFQNGSGCAKTLSNENRVSSTHRGLCTCGRESDFRLDQTTILVAGFLHSSEEICPRVSCCQAVANPKGVSVIEGRIAPRCEFDILGMDLVKLPKSVEGSRHVLVVMDHFTRFAWAHPIKRKTAAEVMNAFLKTNVPTSRPRILLSDNGPEFKNSLMSSYCKAMGITQHFWSVSTQHSLYIKPDLSKYRMHVRASVFGGNFSYIRCNLSPCTKSS